MMSAETWDFSSGRKHRKRSSGGVCRSGGRGRGGGGGGGGVGGDGVGGVGSTCGGGLGRRLRCIKLLVLGGPGAGKTCLLLRYIRGTLGHDFCHAPTIGADFFTKRIINPLLADFTEATLGVEANTHAGEDAGVAVFKRTLLSSVFLKSRAKGEPHLNVQLWDTAGQERFSGVDGSALGSAFFRYADGALLVYDSTSMRSFHQLVRWYKVLLTRVSLHRGEGSDGKLFPIVVVANKIDRLKEEVAEPFRRLVPQRNVLGYGYCYRWNDRILWSRNNGNHVARGWRTGMEGIVATAGLRRVNLGDVKKRAGRTGIAYVLATTGGGSPSGTTDACSTERKEQDILNENMLTSLTSSLSPPATDVDFAVKASSFCYYLTGVDFYGTRNGVGCGVNGSGSTGESISFADVWSSSSLCTSSSTPVPVEVRYPLRHRKAEKKETQPSRSQYFRCEDHLPDQEAVLAWCRRFGLSHVETSAWDGTGVNNAVETLVALTMQLIYVGEEKGKRAERHVGNVQSASLSTRYASYAGGNKQIDCHHVYKPNKKIDLYARYAGRRRGKTTWNDDCQSGNLSNCC